MKVYAAVAALLCAAAILFAPFAARTTEYAAAQQGNAVQDVMNAAYARANSRTAYFCTDADLSTGIFAVPYTYCVEILGEEGEWYRVKYAEDYGIYRALYGYVLKSDFTPLEQAPQTVYLYKSVSVTFSQDQPSGNLPVIDDITVIATNKHSLAARRDIPMYCTTVHSAISRGQTKIIRLYCRKRMKRTNRKRARHPPPPSSHFAP